MMSLMLQVSFMYIFCICSFVTVIFEMLNFLLFYRLLLVCLLSELDYSSAFPRGETDRTLFFYLGVEVILITAASLSEVYELCAEFSSKTLVLNRLNLTIEHSLCCQIERNSSKIFLKNKLVCKDKKKNTCIHNGLDPLCEACSQIH